jgi:hypothetical protein
LAELASDMLHNGSRYHLSSPPLMATGLCPLVHVGTSCVASGNQESADRAEVIDVFCSCTAESSYSRFFGGIGWTSKAVSWIGVKHLFRSDQISTSC